MTPQEIEQKTIEYMNTKMPIESSIVDRHTIYHSTSTTHRSYASQLMNASRGSGVYRTYLIRHPTAQHNQRLTIFAQWNNKQQQRIHGVVRG
jgi:hypothetical protein